MRIYPVILTDQVLDLIRQNRTTWELYETVSVLPPNDNFFVKGHTDADIQTFAMSNLVGSVESVKCVQLCLRNFLTGAPSVNKVTPVVRLAGHQLPRPRRSSPGMAASRWECKLWETNPTTSSALGEGRHRCDGVWLEVDEHLRG